MGAAMRVNLDWVNELRERAVFRGPMAVNASVLRELKREAGPLTKSADTIEAMLLKVGFPGVRVTKKAGNKLYLAAGDSSTKYKLDAAIRNGLNLELAKVSGAGVIVVRV